LWFAVLAASLLAAGRAFGDEGVAATGGSVSPALWLKITAAIGTLRLALKLFQPAIQRALTALIARVNDSPETDDDERLHTLMDTGTYLIAAFLADYLLSIKLPTSDALKNHRLNQSIEKFRA
jgi:hypothetical protein